MTLLIACLLIYHLDLSPWWYGLATALWVFRAWAIDKTIRSNVAAIRHFIVEANARSR